MIGMGKAITRTPLIAQHVPKKQNDWTLNTSNSKRIDIISLVKYKIGKRTVYAPISLPTPVVGDISPYPTVVMVMIAHQNELGILS